MGPDADPSPAADGASGSGAVHGGATMPVRGELTGRFGAPTAGTGRSAKEWFIRCPVGEEVRAIAAGRVVHADWLRRFGNLLIVDHGDGQMSEKGRPERECRSAQHEGTPVSLYGNNDALLASVGSTVRMDEAIAQAGASGASPEPGLYFEVRPQGTAVDPAAWIGR